MNVQGLCASGAADGAKIRRLIKLAEREGVVVVAVQESWFKKQRNEDEMVQAVAGTDWRWFGARRKKQKRKDKKGEWGSGVLGARQRGASENAPRERERSDVVGAGRGERQRT